MRETHFESGLISHGQIGGATVQRVDPWELEALVANFSKRQLGQLLFLCEARVGINIDGDTTKGKA